MSIESELNEFREKWLEEIRAEQSQLQPQQQSTSFYVASAEPGAEPATEPGAEPGAEPATEVAIEALKATSKRCYEAWEAVGFAKHCEEHMASIDAFIAERQAIAKMRHAAWEAAGFATPSRERTAYMDAHMALAAVMRQKWP